MRNKSDSKAGKKKQPIRPRVPAPERVDALETEATAAVQRATAGDRQALSPNDVLSLQQTVGNRTVQRVLDDGVRVLTWDAGRLRQTGLAAARPRVQRAVDHTTGKEVDTYVKAHDFIKDYVKTKVEGGTKAEGVVHIHTAAKFKEEWKKYAMARKNPSTGARFTEDEANAWEPKVNAFQGDGEIHIHEDRGEAGTAIHESMHLFADESFLSKLGFNANEGATEFFTRMICEAQKITRGSFYKKQRKAVDKLVAATSKTSLADAYFKGSIDGLKTAVDGAKEEGTFDKWKGYMKRGKYIEANNLM
jgi:hypothetical protein